MMSLREILEFAQAIARDVRNGLKAAAHYLRSMNVDFEIARWALLGA
jgi:hypothetical protein